MYCVKCFFLLFILKLNFGYSKFTFRSVGGRDALKGEFPFILSLELKIQNIENMIFCTASALSPIWAITAGHCVVGIPITQKDGVVSVVVWHNLLDINHTEESEIISIVPHPGYTLSESVITHDIALIETKQTMNVGAFAKLSSLDSVSVVGLQAFSVGYGLRNVTESRTTLQVVEGMLNRCEKDVSSRYSLIVCLMPLCSAAGGASSSPGDSGGPVLHTSGVVGIASRVTLVMDVARRYLKSDKNAPVCVASLVSPYFNWISDVMRRNKSYNANN